MIKLKDFVFMPGAIKYYFLHAEKEIISYLIIIIKFTYLT